jgi:Flp pilus assembly protein TadG
MFEIIGTKLTHAARRLSACVAARRFVKHQEGAAAIEFGMVAAPFLALMFAIMETALVFFAGQALETAAADSARMIMTGQAQTQAFSNGDFKNAVCSKVYGLFNCGSGIYVDVKTFPSFAAVNLNNPIGPDGKLVENFNYQPGGPGDIVVVRLFYQWPVFVSLLGFNLADMADNKRLLAATAIFRNEPYQ